MGKRKLELKRLVLTLGELFGSSDADVRKLFAPDNYTAALKLCDIVIKQAQRTDNTLSSAVALTHKGTIHNRFEEWSKAEKCLQNAVAQFKEAGEYVGIVIALIGLSDTHLGLYDYNAALQDCQDALTVLPNDGVHKWLMGTCLVADLLVKKE